MEKKKIATQEGKGRSREVRKIRISHARSRWKPLLLVTVAVALGLVFLSGSCPGPVKLAAPPATPNLDRVVMGYYPSWRRSELDHTRVHFEFLTHLAHAFTRPDGQGNLVVPEDYLYPELVERAHRHGVKVLMSIGGWENCEGFPGMASTPETRSRFIGQVVDFVTRYGYDGVDIDWEFPSTAEEREHFVRLAEELSAALKAQKRPLLLTMAAPSGHYWGQWINYEEMVAYFDYISAMTYDFHGQWSDHSGHNSPLYSCGGDVCGSVHDSVVYFLSRRVPPEKLLLGLAFFGRSFDSGGLYQKFQKSAYYAYVEVVDLLNAGWVRFWDDCASVPFVQSPDRGTMVSYDDQRSIFLKCQYAIASNIAGVIIWEITLDEERGDGPVLLGTVGKAFSEKKEKRSPGTKVLKRTPDVLRWP